MTTSAPRLIKGRYEVLDSLGAGGEGYVVKALDHQHDRLIALKIRAAGDEHVREELLNEARVLLAVPPHPALPLVREDFFDHDTYVVAMDWVEGTDLARLLRERGRPGLAPSSVLAYLAQAAEALTHLHAQDPPIIHGDVKPANLILTKGGRVKLVDFGLSSAPAAPRRRAGTPGFRAPELAADGAPSRASDVFSLAATAFALLSGSAPAGRLPSWDGIEPAQAEQLEAALRRGLATDPTHRPPTPGELVESLRSGWGAALPTGVMTFCLSDIEGSTTLWDDDPAAMAAALVRHDELITAQVEARGGHVIKSMGEGDSTVSVFESAPRALEAALAATHALQEEPWPGGLKLAVRFGLHTGEAERRGADYFGPTLNLAARLRGEADGSQIFVSAATAALVAQYLPAGCELVDLGPHRLRGPRAREQIHALKGPGLSAPLPTGESPYRGLLAFEPDDRRFFFGRETVVEEILARLEPGRLLAVIGASGSGKSSLLRAGVVGALGGGTIVTPGDRLPDDGLLVVDQFEELYTLRDERDDFIDRLLAHPGPVAIAMRADLYGKLSDHPGLARAVADNQILLGGMGETELERAITEPARVAGLRLEPGLVELILREVAREPGALPLLSHALRETWAQRDGRTLTVESYRASGGVASALAQTADSVVSAVPPDRQALVRNLFLRLTELGDGIEDTRRRVAVDELVPDGAAAEEIQALLDRLAEARLVTLGDGTAEVAHEVLIREWPTLRAWVEEDRAGFLLHRQLGDAARLWDVGGSEPGDLYRGTRLGAAVDWARSHPDQLNAGERAFLDASVAEAERDRRTQLRTNRRLRLLLAGVGLLLVAAVIAGVLALRESDRSRDIARTSDAQRLGAEALVEDEFERSLLLAQAGRELDDSVATRGYLLSALLRHPGAIGVMQGDESGTGSLALSPDNGVLAAGSFLGNVVLIDTRTRERIGEPLKVVEDVNSVDFSPDGRLLAVAGPIEAGQSVQLIDLATRQRKAEIDVGFYPRHPEKFESAIDARFSADGRAVIATLAPKHPDAAPVPAYVRRYDARTGAPLGRGVFVPGTSAPVVPSRRDRLVFASRGAAYVVDAATLRVQRRFPEGGFAVGLSPDGRTAALGAEGGSVSVLDLRTGENRTLSGRHENRVHGVEFTPDGRTLASRSDDGKVLVWDVSSGTVRETLAGHNSSVTQLVVSEDGRTLYTGGLDERIIVWDIAGDRRLARPFQAARWRRSERPGPPPFAVSPSGDTVAAGLRDGGVRLTDSRTLGRLRDLPGIEGAWVNGLEFSPDGRTIATAGENGAVEVRDAETGRRMQPTLYGFGQPVESVAFSPDGSRLVVTDLEGNMRVSDLETGGVREAPQVHGFPTHLSFSPDGETLAVVTEGGFELRDGRSLRVVASLRNRAGDDDRWVRFSPDGRLLAVTSWAGYTQLWDVKSREPAGPRLEGHEFDVYNAEFSRDGRLLATSGFDGAVILWDVESRRALGTIPGPLGPTSIRFAPDGRTLFVLHDLGGAKRLPVEPDAWSQHACAVAGRDLTRGQWDALAPDQDYRSVCS